MPTRVLILGATSAIAHEVARCYAREGARLVVAARDADRLAANAADLRARGATDVVEVAFDALDFDRHGQVVADAWTAFDGLDAVLVAYGSLPDPAAVASDADAAVASFRLNATSVIAVLTHLAGRFEAAGGGTIAVLSSVAGDRGRPSNPVYGAAKGAVSTFCQGLRARLSRSGVRLVTVKPGPVDTPMTAHLDLGRLVAEVGGVGRRVHRAMRAGGDVVYVPGVWRVLMAGVRAVPERVFKRLDL